MKWYGKVSILGPEIGENWVSARQICSRARIWTPHRTNQLQNISFVRQSFAKIGWRTSIICGRKKRNNTTKI